MVLGQDVASSVQGTSKPVDRAQKRGTRQWNIGAVMTDGITGVESNAGSYSSVGKASHNADEGGLRSLEM
jgi:hypothetical protein